MAPRGPVFEDAVLGTQEDQSHGTRNRRRLWSLVHQTTFSPSVRPKGVARVLRAVAKHATIRGVIKYSSTGTGGAAGNGPGFTSHGKRSKQTVRPR